MKSCLFVDKTAAYPFDERLFPVIPARFERAAYCLEGSCSIQLSYGTNLWRFSNTTLCKSSGKRSAKIVKGERNGKPNRRFEIAIAEPHPIFSRSAKIVKGERNGKSNRRFEIAIAEPYPIFSRSAKIVKGERRDKSNHRFVCLFRGASYLHAERGRYEKK